MAKQTTLIDVPVILSDEERIAFATDLAGVIHAKRELEDEKKQVAADFKARLDELTGDIHRLSRIVADGTQVREVEATVEPDYEEGIVRVVRLDTGEIAKVRPMRPEERQIRVFPPLREAEESDL